MKQDDIGKQFRRFLFAYILVALSGCLGNIVGGIVVGNLVSVDGVSAINLSRPIIQFTFTMHLLINAGAGMLVAYALGRGDRQQADITFTRALSTSLGVSLVMALVGGILLPGQTVSLFCSDPDLQPLTHDYMRVLLLGAPAYVMMWGLSTMTGVDGSPRLVSVAVIVDNVVNILLNLLFIGTFRWGITGSSAATVTGHLTGILILLTHWLGKGTHLRLKWMAGGYWKSLKSIVAQGAPLAVASICLTLLMYSANHIVLSTVGRQGLFAFAVCMNLLQIYNLFLSGTCQTLQSLGAILVGRKDADALRTVLRKAFRFITVAMAVTCIAVWAMPDAIARLFGAKDAGMLLGSRQALRVFALSFIPFCYIYVLMIVYKLFGQHRMSLFIAFALSLTVIPVLWLMSRLAPQLIWYSYLAAYLLEGATILVLHRMMHIEFRLGGKSG